MDKIYKKIHRAIEFIQNRTVFEPEVGIILGTGLGNLVSEIDIVEEIKYSDIPYFPLSTVESHKGRLIFGHLKGRKVVAMQGRFHYYEGYSMQQLVFPVRVLKFLGINRLFISNAAGSVNPDIEIGDLMIIRDHINLLPENPLRGENYEELGPRFPDLFHAYDKSLIEKGLQIAREKDIRCHSGVYVSVQGPNLETIAEYRYIHIIGGDAVGMSTVPEVLAACHMGLPVFAISVITDKGYPAEEVKEVTVEDVIAIAGEAEPHMTVILRELIGGLS